MSDGRLRQPFLDRFPALVGLDDDINCVDAVEVPSVAILLPIRSSRNAERRESIVPEGMNVAFPFDQGDMSGVSCFGPEIERHGCARPFWRSSPRPWRGEERQFVVESGGLVLAFLTAVIAR